MKKVFKRLQLWFWGLIETVMIWAIKQKLKPRFHYSGNLDIHLINHFAKKVYHMSGRKPLAGVSGMVLQDGPGRQYVSGSYPTDKQLALNILKEMERQITGRTLCARDRIGKTGYEK